MSPHEVGGSGGPRFVGLAGHSHVRYLVISRVNLTIKVPFRHLERGCTISIEADLGGQGLFPLILHRLKVFWDKFSGRISRSHRPLPFGKVQPQFAVVCCCLHETRLRVAHFPFRQLNRRGRIQGGPAELYELFGASDGKQLACSPSARASHRNRV